MKSMTGFGKASASDAQFELTVELRSVNNRYLETAIRIPKEFSAFENKIRSSMKAQLSRGKVNVFVSLSKVEQDGEAPVLHPELASRLFRELTALNKTLQIEAAVSLQDLLSYHSIADTGGITLEAEQFEALLKPALNKALQQLNTMRGEEGSHLLADIQTRIENIQHLTKTVQESAKSNVRMVFDKMVQNVEDLIGSKKIDQTRLEQEIALISDKVDITEECVRMESHLKLFRKTIAKTGEAGKKLTFILQEMLREANTMNSKNADIEIQHQVIKIKEEIEKIREQVQNIE